MKTILNIKTEKKIKENAKKTAEELGIPLSTAINAFLKQFIRDRELTLSASYKPSAYLREVILESEKELEENKSTSFKGVDVLIKSMRA
jgi:addiction module RelB/DinJ family antitoxin